MSLDRRNRSYTPVMSPTGVRRLITIARLSEPNVSIHLSLRNPHQPRTSEAGAELTLLGNSTSGPPLPKISRAASIQPQALYCPGPSARLPQPQEFQARCDRL